MGKKLRGFDDPDALLTAPETRSSSPVRILRGENRECPTVRGLFPCGEGAGYAGGITSAAVDGLRCAEEILRRSADFSPHPDRLKRGLDRGVKGLDFPRGPCYSVGVTGFSRHRERVSVFLYAKSADLF